MVFRWLRRRRRKRWQSEGLSEEARQSLHTLPILQRLSESSLRRLEGLTRVFMEEKNFEGCGGLEMTDKIRGVIASQACLLILELDHDWFHRVRTVLVYPSTFRNAMQWRDENGVVRHLDAANLGEAWPGGPIVLAWDAAYQGGRKDDDGFNTVIHEFAHKLDMLDGETDGVPPLPSAERQRWESVLAREYEAAQRAAAAGRKSFLDSYAATNPAELFAVASESFFERPRGMQRKHEELYGLMRDFYRQDPASEPARAG